MPPSHGLTGFAAIETVAKKRCLSGSQLAGRSALATACCAPKLPHRRLGAAAGVSRLWAFLGGRRDRLFSRAQARRKHPFGRLPANTENAPDSPQKQEQIQGPEKRLHRTVLRALLLSNQERKAPPFSTRAAAGPACGVGLRKPAHGKRCLRLAGGYANRFADWRCAANPPCRLRCLFIACFQRSQRPNHFKIRSK